MNEQNANSNIDSTEHDAVTREDARQDAIQRQLRNMESIRANHQSEIDENEFIIDMLTRGYFSASLAEALRGIMDMCEGKPVMSALMEKALSLYSVRPNHKDDVHGNRMRAGLCIVYGFSMWSLDDGRTSDERNKALYYEIMSFCRDGDAPFCDPNCTVKVDSGTTLVLPLTHSVEGIEVTVRFRADAPDAVLAHLNKKGMLHTNEGYVAAPSFSIVCPSGN